MRARAKAIKISDNPGPVPVASSPAAPAELEAAALLARPQPALPAASGASLASDAASGFAAATPAVVAANAPEPPTAEAEPEAAASPAEAGVAQAAAPTVAEPEAAASPAEPVAASTTDPDLQRTARILLSRQKHEDFRKNQLRKTQTFANQEASSKADLKSQVDESDAVFSIFMQTIVAAVHVACVRDQRGPGRSLVDLPK